MSVSSIEHAEKFLFAFNEIERVVRQLYGSDYNRESFASVLNSLRNKHRVINSFIDDLRNFSELRNAIVHSRRPDYAIAYPAEEVVRKIQVIAEELVRPPKVITLFQKKVFTVEITSVLSEVLNMIRDNNISQVPVVDGLNVVEMLNGNSIARWLSIQDIIEPGDTPIKDVLDSIERKKNFNFIGRNTNVYEAAGIYEDSLKEGWYMDALLITNEGKNGQGLEGIAVLEDEDIAQYFKNAGKA